MPWVPLVGAAICLVQMVGLPGSAWERLVIWLVIGLCVYFGYGRRRAARVRSDIRVGRQAA